MKKWKNLTPFRTALIYAVFSAVWILISDEALSLIISRSSSDYIFAQTLKGWFFVVISAALIYFILQREMQSLQEKQNHINYQASLNKDVSDALISVDMQFKVVSWNPAAEKIYGWKADEMLGLHLENFVKTEYLDNETLETALQHMAEHGWWKGEIRQTRRDGTCFPVFASVTFVKNENGENIGYVGVNRDITESKRAEEQLEYQANLLKHINDAVIAVDDQFHITAWNHAAEVMYGWSSAEAIGSISTTIIRAEMTKEERDEILKELQETGTYHRDLIQYRKDGSPLFVEANTIALRDKDNRLTGLVSVNRDITARKQAEDNLRRSQQTYRNLFENNPHPMWVYDLETLAFLMVNDAAVDHYGYSKDEFLAMTIKDIRPKEDLPALLNNLAQSSNTLERSSGWRHLKKDGTLIDVEITSHAIQFEGRSARLVLANDVTERKQADEKLRASEERYRNLVENMNEVVMEVDAQGNFCYISPNYVTLSGYTPEEELNGPAFAHIHPDELPLLLQNVEKTMKGEQQNISIRVQNKNGEWRWIETSGKPYQAEDGSLHIISVARDITQRRRTEEELNKSEERFQKAFRSGPVGLAITRASDGIYIDANKAYSELTGFSYEELIGHTSLELRITTPEQRRGYVQQIGEQGFIHNQEMALRHRSGQFRIFLGSMEIIELNHEICVLSTAIDITERKQAEESIRQYASDLEQKVDERTIELTRANRAKDEFLANMSHELRTPLNGILGFSETLLIGIRGPLNEKQEQAVQLISSSGQHLLGLINDILDVSKIEAGKTEIHPETFSVNDICRASLSLIRELATKKFININFSQLPNSLSIFADSRSLKQMLVNLLSNAVKFTPENGEISLEVFVDADQNQIHFSVIDNGVGIAAEDIKRLFNPFVQLDHRLSRQNQGTGLGLMLVRKLAELHGGSVGVESQLGKGSRFTLILPWQQRMEMQRAVELPKINSADVERTGDVNANSLETPLTDHYTVLLAEDNEANAIMIHDYLEICGYNVVMAHTGPQVLKKADEESPDIILMDIQMPDIDGLEIIQVLRKDARFHATPIIALTALTMAGDRERCLEAGANEYLSKPVSLKKLKQMIETFLVGKK